MEIMTHKSRKFFETKFCKRRSIQMLYLFGKQANANIENIITFHLTLFARRLSVVCCVFVRLNLVWFVCFARYSSTFFGCQFLAVICSVFGFCFCFSVKLFSSLHFRYCLGWDLVLRLLLRVLGGEITKIMKFTDLMLKQRCGVRHYITNCPNERRPHPIRN